MHNPSRQPRISCWFCLVTQSISGVITVKREFMPRLYGASPYPAPYRNLNGWSLLDRFRRGTEAEAYRYPFSGKSVIWIYPQERIEIIVRAPAHAHARARGKLLTIHPPPELVNDSCHFGFSLCKQSPNNFLPS